MFVQLASPVVVENGTRITRLVQYGSSHDRFALGIRQRSQATLEKRCFDLADCKHLRTTAGTTPFALHVLMVGGHDRCYTVVDQPQVNAKTGFATRRVGCRIGV